MAEVRLNTNPQDVQVLLNGYDQGVTPLTLSLDRKQNHNVTFMIQGMQPIHVQIKPKLDFGTTILGNLVSWNVMGVVVDLVTGHAYTLSPAEIERNFDSITKTLKIELTPNEINLVLITKPEWEKINTKEHSIVSN